VRVLAATADAAVGRGPLVAAFAARFVFGLDDEDLSVALLGTPGGGAGPERAVAPAGAAGPPGSNRDLRGAPR